VIYPDAWIDQIANEVTVSIGEKVVTEPDAIIVYFTGKLEIFSTESSIGKVSAWHRPSLGDREPSGAHIYNKVLVKIAFQKKVKFVEAVRRAHILQDYFGLLMGRPQEIKELQLHVGEHTQHGEHNIPIFLKVYGSISIQNRHRTSSVDTRLHPGDALSNGGFNQIDFALLLTNWLSRHDEWEGARSRFFNCFAKQRSFDTDRLIAAANMFDILPATAVPKKVEIAEGMRNAKAAAKAMFKKLPKTLDCDSVLNALGRIGESSLKQKVHHRIKFLANVTPLHFEDLRLVTGTAIDCRNFFVHGTKIKLSTAQIYEWLPFFTSTLEFVFAMSDLIEAGWSNGSWIANRNLGRHPFQRYISEHRERIGSFHDELKIVKA
jgi:ApeA N-terminal domain 1